jgi:hypothetical protein
LIAHAEDDPICPEPRHSFGHDSPSSRPPTRIRRPAPHHVPLPVELAEASMRNIHSLQRIPLAKVLRVSQPVQLFASFAISYLLEHVRQGTGSSVNAAFMSGYGSGYGNTHAP